MKKFLLVFAALSILIAMSCGDGQPSGEQKVTTEESKRSAGQSAIADEGSQANIVQIAVNSDDHSTLVAALKAADYVDFLANPGPFTVFAPTNDAFDDLPDGVLDDLLKPENVNNLKDVLEFHVLIGVYETESMRDGQTVGTANVGLPHLVINKLDDGSVTVNGHNVVASVRASNGVVHVIDGVLVP